MLELYELTQVRKHRLKLISGLKVRKRYTIGPGYWNVPVMVNTDQYFVPVIA